MKVLAIDPGFSRCGVAVLEKEKGNAREHVIYSACIETDAKAPFPERLRAVALECTRLMTLHKPDTLALERLYFNTNQKTALQVAEVRGALIDAAARAQIALAEYTPAQVKMAVTGSGRADKKQVAQMIHTLVTLTQTPKHDDEYDAIAIGITHLANVR